MSLSYGVLSFQEFGSRMYDPLVGRWWGVDPALQFHSPYLAMGNSPYMFVDPNGEFVTWSIGNGGLSIGFNLTPIGIPLGGGFNVGWGDGFSLGRYVEAGYRVGGTGFGAGATVSQSFDYNFKHQNLSTTTSIGAYASFAVFNAGVGASQAYDISNNQWHDPNWSVSAGVGIGDHQKGIGANVSYGSAGWNYGLGGYVSGENGLKSNSRVLQEYVEKGDHQGALDYFGFEGEYVPNKTSQNYKAKEYWGATNITTGKITYGNLAFTDYETLRLTYYKEKYTANNVLSGRGIGLAPN